jgi:5-methylcytosine-specific restriction endonuclease McrA
VPDKPQDFRPKSYRKPRKQCGSPDKRRAGWARTDQRKRVLARDDYTCASCLEVFPEQELIADHRIPLYKHGSDDDDNIQLLCHTCDLIKQRIEQADRAKRPPDFYLSHLLSQLFRVKATTAVPVTPELWATAERYRREQLENEP